KQGKYDLSVSFEMAGGKFQKKFKDIGGELEDTFFMDFMEKTDDPRFKIYKLAYSAFLSRITVKDVIWVKDKGIKLMDGYYWDFINDPHLLVAGGTGGGKTVLLRSILRCRAEIGV
ncbi:cell division protein FtsK, partial [Streptococcus agalactiae]